MALFMPDYSIKLEKVDLGVKKVQIPVSRIKGNGQGPTLLVTAGVDGDEYASIEASYRVINEYQSGNFDGVLNVVPILNIPGFENISSFNPMDGKYPKNIFPGKRDGSSSERLIYWLDSNFLSECDFWLDLHGGAINEELFPFVFLYETKNKKLSKLNDEIISSLDTPKIVYLKPGYSRKAELLAKRNTGYAIFEAGCLGGRQPREINRHVYWVKTVMETLGMIRQINREKTEKEIFRRFTRYRGNRKGLWYPMIKNGIVQKGQKIGEIRTFQNQHFKEIKSPQSGEILWFRQSMFFGKDDILYALSIKD